MNCSRVEDHASEGTVLDVLVVVGHVDLPLPRLVRLEGGVEGSVVLADRTAERSVGGTVGRHLQQLRAGGVVRIDLNNKTLLSSQFQDGQSVLPTLPRLTRQRRARSHRNPSSSLAWT